MRILRVENEKGKDVVILEEDVKISFFRKRKMEVKYILVCHEHGSSNKWLRLPDHECVDILLSIRLDTFILLHRENEKYDKIDKLIEHPQKPLL